MPVLQEKAAEVLAAYHSSQWASSLVVTFSQLAALCCPDVCADESTLYLALLQLQREKKAAVSLHYGEKVTGGRNL